MFLSKHQVVFDTLCKRSIDKTLQRSFLNFGFNLNLVKKLIRICRFLLSEAHPGLSGALFVFLWKNKKAGTEDG